jgi:nucleotide-binding universal stress UspA family protein
MKKGAIPRLVQAGEGALCPDSLERNLIMSLTDVIEVCTDGSELSLKGVDTAVELAQSLNLPLLGMTAVLDGKMEQAQKRLAEVEEKAKAAGIQYELVAEPCKAPYEGILAVGRRHDARFIVMASRGLSTFGSLLLGSETQKTLAAADRPVLVIR